MGNQNMSMRLEVVDRKQVPLCPESKTYDISWPQTAPSQVSIQDCPHKYNGKSYRMCKLVDSSRPKWNVPDFSKCESELVESIDANVSIYIYFTSRV